MLPTSGDRENEAKECTHPRRKTITTAGITPPLVRPAFPRVHSRHCGRPSEERMVRAMSFLEDHEQGRVRGTTTIS